MLLVLKRMIGGKMQDRRQEFWAMMELSGI